MEIINSYIDYRKQKPNYETWKEERDNLENTRLSYVQNNNIPQAQKQQDIKRAQAVLRAVDVMDEYSQTRAEDAEIITQGVVQSVSPLLTIPGALIGLLVTLKSSKLQEKLGESALGIGAAAGTLIASMISFPFLAQWGASKEIEASKDGRFEAMQKDLSNVKQFAVLDEKQEKQVEEIAKTIKISPKEAKKMDTARGGFLKAIGSFFKDDNKETQKAKKEFKEKIKNDAAQIDKLQLNEQEIEEAKKDRQLIQNIVEKIDIASQDYAENIELATTATSLLGAGSSALISAIANKALSLTKITPTKRGAISLAIGGLGAFASTIYATKLQKQASRVARFKTKQDFLNNPDKLVYVDDEKVKNSNIQITKNEEKKKNFFEFLAQVIKDNKDYNAYLKNENVAQKQKIKALEQIELTPEQEKRARQLQNNTFKMFNKLDEKSQQYSEHTEALGEIVQSFGGSIAALFMMTGMGKAMSNIMKIDDSAIKSTANAAGASIKAMWPMYKKMLISFVPLMLLNAFVTKEQKGASRVADMQAIQEMDDYRHFADTSPKTQTQHLKQEKTTSQQENINSSKQTKDVFAAFKK